MSSVPAPAALAERQRSSLGDWNTDRVAQQSERQGHGDEVCGAVTGTVATAAVAPTAAQSSAAPDSAVALGLAAAVAAAAAAVGSCDAPNGACMVYGLGHVM